MSKYNKEFKLKFVQYYLKNNISTKKVAKHFKMKDDTSLKIWIRRYKKHGIKGLERNKVSYDGNFKVSVVEYMHNNHLSLAETAVHFNLSGPPLIAKWERIYYEEGPQALFVERRGRKLNMKQKSNNKKENKTNEELLEELEYLRMENAYLKKLHALIQKRDNPQNKKK